jgi:hypothetical protein
MDEYEYGSRCKLLNLDTLCVLLFEKFHRTAYGLNDNEPLNCAFQNFNNNIQCFDFCLSWEGFHELF